MKNKNLNIGLISIVFTVISLILLLVITSSGMMDYNPETLFILASALTGTTVLVITYYAFKIFNLKPRLA